MSQRLAYGGSVRKRILDVAVASVGLVLSAPLLLPALAATWFAMGRPLIFRQARIGKDGYPFNLLKIRTMRVGAPDLRNADGSAVCSADDPRVTGVGRVLRATSIDELPQLLNVLRGDMSVVGPRPELPDQMECYTPRQRLRLRVRPGLTGLAQVSGRNARSWSERLELDTQYVERQSFWADVRLLARTIPVLLSRRGVTAPASALKETERHVANR